MPMYMDIHEVNGATAEAVAKAHAADVEVQGKHGVEYHKYWFNEAQGKIFCLCSAPSPEAAAMVHRQAHGLEAAKIIEVAPEIADGFMGGCEVNAGGAALVPGTSANERDPGIRTILFTDIVGSTELTQRVGDDAAMAFLNVHDEIVREALRSLGGREVKHTGDGIMACFVSLPQRRAAPTGSSARWRTTRRRTAKFRSRCGSAPPPENPSRITTIFSASRSSWPRAFAPTPGPNSAWCPTSSPSFASAKV